MNRIPLVIVGLVGCVILGAAAFASISHSHADLPGQILICASVAGLIVGSVTVARAKSHARWLIVPLVLCGECYTGWNTFERVVELRAARTTIGREQATAVSRATERLNEATDALLRAQAAVRDKASLKGCKQNCRQLLQDAVNAAASERDAARAALGGLPEPMAVDVSSTVIGVAPWEISLVMAILGVLATSGLSSALIYIAAHEWPKPATDSVRKETISERFPPEIDPPTGGKRRKQGTVVQFPAKHPVLTALANVGGSVSSNQELAKIMSVSEGESSKRWQEVADQLVIRREGKSLRIALRKTA